MTFGTFDRKIGIRFAVGLAAVAILWLATRDRSASAVAVGVTDSVPMAEKRLERLRQIAATVPGKEVVTQKAVGELIVREKGILKAETSSLAQAQLQELLHKVGAANGIDIRGVEEMRIKPFGNDYGEASVTVRFTCLIEQLVNLLAALATQPELVSTSQIQISGGPDKNKTIQVRLTLSGVVPKKLALEKKTGSGL
jgi:hypothetical protein